MMSDLAHNIGEVRRRIEEATLRACRQADEVRLIAVSKIFPASAIREAYRLGLRDFGENYVQEFEGKASELPDLAGARFHFIGHLQSNKARRAAELFDAIQTIDSERLARRLNDAGKPLEVMIEVKLSPEESKTGTGAESLGGLVETVRACPNLTLAGLMTMPPWSDDPEFSRPYFRGLRELAARFGLARLSMGMSHDLEVAIEEGSTDVRVGTALFGPRRYP